MAFPRYDSYKNSGEDWIGDVPEHWDVLRTKNVFRLVAEPAPKNNDEELLSVYSDIGVKPRRELEARGNKASTTDGYWIVKKGDVIVNKLLAWMGAIGVSDYDGVTSPAYDILRARKPIDSKFYHYLFRTQICIDKLKKHSKGIMEMRLRLYFDEFGNIKIPYPPIEEQNRIVEFLDRTTTEIDQAIAKKQRLIELLQEQKAILINQAVTKGLNPNVPMRDSGIEWIGKIPEHWEIKKLKYISKIKYGLGQPPREKENGLPLIRATNVERGKIVEKDLVRVDPDDIPYQRDPVLKTGDIIVVRSGAYTADSAIVTEKYSGSIAGYDMVLTAKRDVNPEYLAFCLLAKYVLYDQLYLLRMRAAQPHLNAEELGETLIIIPPFDEQAKIILLLQKLNQDQEVTFAITNREINLLNELKKLVIANAVTGKLKVCDRTF